jgi:hypothetical protein
MAPGIRDVHTGTVRNSLPSGCMKCATFIWPLVGPSSALTTSYGTCLTCLFAAAASNNERPTISAARLMNHERKALLKHIAHFAVVRRASYLPNVVPQARVLLLRRDKQRRRASIKSYVHAITVPRVWYGMVWYGSYGTSISTRTTITSSM